MKKRAISLVALVITIIVMIIISGTIILMITSSNLIPFANKAVFKSNAGAYKKEVELWLAKEKANNLKTFDASDVNVSKANEKYNGLSLKDIIPSMKEEDLDKFKIYKGELVYLGKDESEIALMEETNVKVYYYGTNHPILAKGMIAVKWENGGWVETTSTDANWYKYENKQWANAISKDTNGNITAYWVWIPRYEYNIEESHSGTTQTIEVNFMRDTIKVPTKGYIMHPAFTFNDTELTGIWVATFESSGSTTALNILPGRQSLKTQTINSMFNACRNMETIYGARYGWDTDGLGIDTHLMKNVEWGAATYLAHSIYGKNEKITMNTSTYYYTGGGSSTAYIGNFAQSTTGNVHGIYDMVGGSWEYTAAYVNNGSSNLTYGSTLVNPNPQYDPYRNIYQTGTANNSITNYLAASEQIGDAIWETSVLINNSSIKPWNSTYIIMPQGNTPFFTRGGAHNISNADILTVSCFTGAGAGDISFRPVLVII